MKSPKRIALFFASILLAVTTLAAPAHGQEEPPAAEAEAQSIDTLINDMMQGPTDFITSIVFYSIKISDTVAIPWVLVWLAFAAIFFTVYFKFVNFRSFGIAARTISGRYSSKDDPGEITHFQALTAALSGTVGLGNIAGVAVAIQLGGPGATFWMILLGFFGMTSKFVECTLGVRFRKIDENGRVHGGPMRYLADGLKDRGMGQLGAALAMFFAVMCIGGSIGGGNLFQINSATDQFISAFAGGEDSFLGQQRWIFGLVVAIIVGCVIIGGIKSIARVTSKLVPIMCGVYILAVIAVIGMHIADLPGAIGKIFTEAFAPQAVGGGLIGCMLQGIKRSAFSNEAGVGSAAIAHSAVKTTKPASEGLVALLEPFVDTVVVCTMTALAIIVTGTYAQEGLEGVGMTSAAFESVMPWFKMVLSLAVILFAFSTMISWSYYGMQAWAYLFGKNPFMDLAYKVMFCSFIVIGASMSLGNVVDFSDAMIFAMSVPNIVGLYFLLPVVKRELEDYRSHCREIDSKS